LEVKMNQNPGKTDLTTSHQVRSTEPEVLPRPTYWPAVLAVGIMFLLWGVVTTIIIAGVGGVLVAIALAGWIGELAHER
jgi:hypothetical protein